jgi:hypothetical protein
MPENQYGSISLMNDPFRISFEDSASRKSIPKKNERTEAGLLGEVRALWINGRAANSDTIAAVSPKAMIFLVK